jgi:sigma-E factor negative regulatory protein RseA
VNFFVSNKTIAELIVEKGLMPEHGAMAANASSANVPKISRDETMLICALGDGELVQMDLEPALKALETADGREAWDLYHRIGDVLRNYGTPDLSHDFKMLLAARLAHEATPGRPSSLTREPMPTVVVPPLHERTGES